MCPVSFAFCQGLHCEEEPKAHEHEELSCRLHQRLGHIAIGHIEGKRNAADTFTKEMKDTDHFEGMAQTITSSRVCSGDTL